MAANPGEVRNEEAPTLRYLVPEENLVTCPYNKAHRVLDARYARHLIKCRTNYLKRMAKDGKRPDYKICRYNYKHHIPQREMGSHEMLCPDNYHVNPDLL